MVFSFYVLLGNGLIEMNNGVYNFDHYIDQSKEAEKIILMNNVKNYNSFEMKALFMY